MRLPAVHPVDPVPAHRALLPLLFALAGAGARRSPTSRSSAATIRSRSPSSTGRAGQRSTAAGRGRHDRRSPRSTRSRRRSTTAPCRPCATTPCLALGGLFVASLGIGWVLSGRALRPVGAIARTAREIQATDLSRRIRLDGPQDELRDLGRHHRLHARPARRRVPRPAPAHRRRLARAAQPARDHPGQPGRLADDAPDADAGGAHGRSRSSTGPPPGCPGWSRTCWPPRAGTPARSPTPTSTWPPSRARRARSSRRRRRAPGLPAYDLTDGPAPHRRPRRAAPGGRQPALQRGTAVPARQHGHHRRPGGPGWLWLAVADEGPGIAADDQPRVFDRFWRGAEVAPRGRDRRDRAGPRDRPPDRRVPRRPGGGVLDARRRQHVRAVAAAADADGTPPSQRPI